MSHTITLNIPDEVFTRLNKTAQETGQSLEVLVKKTLTSMTEDIQETSVQLSQNPFERIENPYRSGNLIQELQKGSTDMFYGRCETIQKLRNILIDDGEGLIIIYGQRRVGKSCLMMYRLSEI